MSAARRDDGQESNGLIRPQREAEEEEDEEEE